MSEPMFTTDCRNGHHGRRCGMTPCTCVCHANERPPAAAPPAPDCPGDRDEACVICGYGSSEHTGAGEMIHEFRPGDPDQQQAAEVAADLPGIEYDGDRLTAAKRIAAALTDARAEEAARWQAKIAAVIAGADDEQGRLDRRVVDADRLQTLLDQQRKVES